VSPRATIADKSRQGHRDSTSEESTNTVRSLFNLCCGSAEYGVEWCGRLPHGMKDHCHPTSQRLSTNSPIAPKLSRDVIHAVFGRVDLRPP
jgi:hypothetical protein